MQLKGAPAPFFASSLAEDVASTVRQGRAVLLWSDGADVIALLADEGEGAEDVLRFAPRVLPEVAS